MPIVYFPEFPQLFTSLGFEARCALMDARHNGAVPTRWYGEVVASLAKLGLVEVEKELIDVPLKRPALNGDTTRQELYESFVLTEDGKQLTKKVQLCLTGIWQERMVLALKRLRAMREFKSLYMNEKKLLRPVIERPLKRLLVREHAIDYTSSRMELVLSDGWPVELKGLPEKGIWVFGVLAGVPEEGVPTAFFRRYFAVKPVMELMKRKLVDVVNVKNPKYILTELGKQFAIAYCEEPKEEVEPEEDEEESGD